MSNTHRELDLVDVNLVSNSRPQFAMPINAQVYRASAVGLLDAPLLAAYELIRWFIGAPPASTRIQRTGSITLGNKDCAHEFLPRHCAFVSYATTAEMSGYATTARHELAVPIELHGEVREQIDALVDWYASAFGLYKVVDQKISLLSGGQKQRLALAATLIMNPRRTGMLSVLPELDPDFRTKFLLYLKTFSELTGGVFLLSGFSEEVNVEAFGQVISCGKIQNESLQGDQGLEFTPPFFDKPILSVDIQSFTYRRSKQPVLRSAAFSVDPSELAFVVGPNGGGKTTLARVVSATLPEWKTYRGSICIGGTELSELSRSEIWKYVSYVPQDPTDYFSRSTVLSELAAYKTERCLSLEEELLDILELNGMLAENPFDLDPADRKKLSFVLAARACSPLLILDEPTQYHDFESLRDFVAAINWIRKRGTAILCITHDQRLLRAFPFAKQHYLTYTENNILESKTQNNIGGIDNNKRAAKTRTLSRLSIAPSNSFSIQKINDLLREDWNVQFTAWSSAFLNILDNWNRRVYPAINHALDELYENVGHGNEHFFYIDVGCGNGWQTVFTTRALESRGLSVQALGIDQCDQSIRCAQALFRNESKANFCIADCTDKEAVRQAVIQSGGGQANLVSAYFVMHDTIDPTGLFSAITATMAPGSWGLFSLLNPGWIEHYGSGENSKSLGFRVSGLDIGSEWIGEFQIEAIDGAVANVPYFHRKLSQYERLLVENNLAVRNIFWVDNGILQSRSEESGRLTSGWSSQVPAEPQSIVILCRKYSS